MWRFEKILLWNLLAAVIVLGQPRPNVKLGSPSSRGLRPDCLGNLLRLSLDEALAVGNQLEVEAINGTENIMLTPGLAAQCGYSMESDPWGNTRIYTSLLGCYVENLDDTTFNVGLKLRMYRNGPSDTVSHDVRQSCSYTRWASKEILCERNYMEVSNYVATPDSPVEAKGQGEDANASKVASDSEQGIWKMTFYTPEPVAMVLREAEQNGYSAMTTSTRLVLRSPYNTAETTSEDVAGIPMEVLKVSVYNRVKGGLNVVNLAAACPTGGVLFTEEMISWHVPRRVTPLMDSGSKVIEMHLGINGQRLDKSQMAQSGYKLSVTDFHIVAEIPVGSPDGYYKSHAPDYQYSITYTVEPMMEILWREQNTNEDARYKILFPITTPVMPQPPHVRDETEAESRWFNVFMGPFLPDVQLRNLTFPTGVLSVEETSAKGFTIKEQGHLNGSKSFALQVPFDSDVVLKHNPAPLTTTYALSVVFGFVVLPEETPFAQQVDLEASQDDVVLPALTGTCDDGYYHVSIRYGSQGREIQTQIGFSTLTPELAQEYYFEDNGTHFHLIVPYDSQDTVFERFDSHSVQGRLSMVVLDKDNQWVLDDLYLICSFPLAITTCYPNGTISAVAVKVQSVPNLVPSWLTLKDQACKPVFSDDRFAKFSFEADSCGTTRTFFDSYMLYENEITHTSNNGAFNSPADKEYRQLISCYYTVNKTETLTFSPQPRSYDPKAEIGSGQLIVQMRLALDSTYELFYQAEDYPVKKYLRQPLYFEVELMQSTDPQLELILENCWATLHEDRVSLPSWDIIVDTCENREDSYVTLFHTVERDSRILVPSLVKRFSTKMFTFIKDNNVLKDEIFVHCDAVICDKNSPAEGSCRGQCVYSASKTTKTPGIKGTRRQRRDSSQQKTISSGPILLSA